MTVDEISREREQSIRKNEGPGHWVLRNSKLQWLVEDQELE